MPERSRLIIAVLAVLVLVAVFAAWIFSGGEPGTDRRARDVSPAKVGMLHKRLLTLDTHVDIPTDWAGPTVDPGPDGRWQVDLAKMREGGLDAAFFIVYVGQGPRDAAGHAEAAELAFQKFAGIRRMTDRLYADEIGLALSARDVERLNKQGKLAALIGIENGYALGGRIELLRAYRDLGARYIGLVHNGHNDLADSAQPRADLGDKEMEHGGLSAFGRKVIREANRLGVLVDVSHASKQATLEAVRSSKAPVIASHSSVRVLSDHPRNLDDETLKAIARKDGVVQVVAFDAYLHDLPAEKTAAVREAFFGAGLGKSRSLFNLSAADHAAYLARMAEIDRAWPRADVAMLADHIDYAVKLIGIDHVGIASDFGGGGGVVGWADASETAAVTAELAGRGYTDKELAKIWGGNLLRVMRKAERMARD